MTNSLSRGECVRGLAGYRLGVADKTWSRRVSAIGFEETSSLGWAIGVDPIAVAVNDHMMMKPTQGGEIVGIVGSTL